MKFKELRRIYLKGRTVLKDLIAIIELILLIKQKHFCLIFLYLERIYDMFV